MKIGLVVSEIICLKGLFLRKKRWSVTFELLNQSSPNLHCQIIPDIFKNQIGDIVIRFWMLGLQIKVNSMILPILTLELVDMATFLEPSEKGD